MLLLHGDCPYKSPSPISSYKGNVSESQAHLVAIKQHVVSQAESMRSACTPNMQSVYVGYY